MKKVRSIITFLKDYLSLIAIIPLLLGGIWQIFLLASISSSYIRFFSVSQQLADGVLILFYFSVLMSPFILFSDYLNQIPTIKQVSNSPFIVIVPAFAICSLISTGIVYTDYIMYNSDIKYNDYSLLNVFKRLFILCYTYIAIVPSIVLFGAILVKTMPNIFKFLISPDRVQFKLSLPHRNLEYG